jgi:hypothetical protein
VSQRRVPTFLAHRYKIRHISNYFYTVTDAIPVVVDVLSWEHKERIRTIAFGDVLS